MCMSPRACMSSRACAQPGETSSSILKALTSGEAVPAGFSQLVKRPVLRPKRVPTQSAPKVVTPEKRESKSDGGSGKTLTDAELKALREERQRVIKEAEQNRRKQMAEEEASAANIVEEADGAEEGADASAFAEEDDAADAAAADEAEEEVEAEDFD